MRRVIDEEKGSSQQGDALHHMAKKECAEHIIASPWLQGARGIDSNQRRTLLQAKRVILLILSRDISSPSNFQNWQIMHAARA
jgi:hypothetical protein